jgi:hypothetical protein
VLDKGDDHGAGRLDLDALEHWCELFRQRDSSYHDSP